MPRLVIAPADIFPSTFPARTISPHTWDIPRLLKRKFENWHTPIHVLLSLTLTDPRRGVMTLTLTLTD